MAEESEDLDEVTELTDLDVENVDLVGKAAIQRTFLIVKHDESGADDMPDPVTKQEEAEEAEAEKQDAARGAEILEEWLLKGCWISR